MVSYVCRTCLYVSHNEFSFKKLEKVKDALENYVPEIKNFLGSNSIVCEQCYQFLKCMKKFREKCLESQNRLCSFNTTNIQDHSNRAIAEARWQLRPHPSYTKQNFNSVSVDRATKRSAERVSVIDFASNNEITSKLFRVSAPKSLNSAADLTLRDLNTGSNSRPTQVQKGQPISSLKVPNTAHASPVDLTVKPIGSAVTSLRSLRKPKTNTTGSGRAPTSSNRVLANDVLLDNSNNDSLEADIPGSSRNTPINVSKLPEKLPLKDTPKSIKNMTVIDITPRNIKNMLINGSVSVKDTPKRFQNLSLLNNNVSPEMPILTCNDDDSDLEIVEVDNDEGNEGKTVELKIRRKSVLIIDTIPDISAVSASTSDDSHMTADENGRVSVESGNNDVEANNNDVICNHHNEFEDMPVLTKVKEEAPDEQNPGFFNKKNIDGLYVCRMCSKVYKTSKGLYNHTKDIHSKDLKFFHCGFCSFFTLWRSALRRHCLNYHARPVKKSKKKAATKKIKEIPNITCATEANNKKFALPTSERLFMENQTDINMPYIVKPLEQKKIPSVLSTGKLYPAVLKCHLPNCNFQTLSKILLNRHSVTCHNFNAD